MITVSPDQIARYTGKCKAFRVCLETGETYGLMPNGRWRKQQHRTAWEAWHAARLIADTARRQMGGQ